jgi:membrane protease YdiL (CAAX protease family)
MKPSAVLAQFAVLVALTWLSIFGLIDLAVRDLPAGWVKPGWPYGYATHAVQLLVALGFIAILKPSFRGNFGLGIPKARHYLWQALWIGALFGPLMLVVDYYPDLLHRRAPPGPYSLTPGNMAPWLLMQGIFVGISEEILFRSLFLGYLIHRVPIRLKFGRYAFSLAGIIIAVAFSLAHAGAFWHVPFPSALGQQAYAIAMGIFYAHLFEQSGSVLAPAIAHNAGDFVEWCLCFALRAAWPQ